MFYGVGVVVIIVCGGGFLFLGGLVGNLLLIFGMLLELELLVFELLVLLVIMLFLEVGLLVFIGEFVESDVDGILIFEGFLICCVVCYLEDLIFGLFNLIGLLCDNWYIFLDGGVVFLVCEDGGWVYVFNSEIDFGGGVGVLCFDWDGIVVDVYCILCYICCNCVGGVMFWGIWLFCEEIIDG